MINKIEEGEGSGVGKKTQIKTRQKKAATLNILYHFLISPAPLDLTYKFMKKKIKKKKTWKNFEM